MAWGFSTSAAVEALRLERGLYVDPGIDSVSSKPNWRFVTIFIAVEARERVCAAKKLQKMRVQ